MLLLNASQPASDGSRPCSARKSPWSDLGPHPVPVSRCGGGVWRFDALLSDVMGLATWSRKSVRGHFQAYCADTACMP